MNDTEQTQLTTEQLKERLSYLNGKIDGLTIAMQLQEYTRLYELMLQLSAQRRATMAAIKQSILG